MKLRLPSILLSAVVAAQMCATATADTVVGSGVTYDVGKAHPYYSGATTSYGELDRVHCWATASANVVQSWQDKYSGNSVATDLPNGVVTKPAGTADGTANLEVYTTILDNSKAAKTGTAQEVFDWWFKNTAAPGATVLTTPRTGDDAKYYDIFTGDTTKKFGDGQSVTDQQLKDAFTVSNGGPVVLTIHQTGSTLPYDDELGSHFAGESRSHSITCWGYETDASGNISAMFLSDSDDLSYGVFKTQAQYRTGYDSLMDLYYGEPNLTSIHLDTDDLHDGYNGNFEVVLQYAYALDTPAAAKLNDGASLAPSTVPEADGSVKQNTKLTANTAISGKGVSVGSGEEGKLVMLTSENGKELKLTGNGAKTSGLSVEKGSLASLDNVSISGYNGSGVELEGRGYLHDGTVSISDNKAENGGAVKTSTYLEIEGNTKVDISGNSATNKGGGIYNAKDGIVSIFGNKDVTFSGNTASKDGGNDIYNAKGGIVNIYNNDKVEFSSSNGGAAVRNEGELYVAAKEGKDVTFVNASLDSRGGKTYVGTDLSGDATDSTGGLKFTNSEGTETLRFLAASEPVEPHTPEYQQSGLMKQFTNFAQRTPAVLENLSVSLNEINGVSADQSAISGAEVVATGALNASKITLDTTSTITANAITLNAVVIDLKDVASSTVGDIITYDLSGLLTASTGVTMNNLVFDTNGLELTEGQQVVVTLGNTLEGTARLLTAEGLRNQTTLADGSVFFSASSPIVPEPATTTLSLLALAGLCARRRRH